MQSEGFESFKPNKGPVWEGRDLRFETSDESDAEDRPPSHITETLYSRAASSASEQRPSANTPSVELPARPKSRLTSRISHRTSVFPPSSTWSAADTSSHPPLATSSLCLSSLSTERVCQSSSPSAPVTRSDPSTAPLHNEEYVLHPKPRKTERRESTRQRPQRKALQKVATRRGTGTANKKLKTDHISAEEMTVDASFSSKQSVASEEADTLSGTAETTAMSRHIETRLASDKESNNARQSAKVASQSNSGKAVKRKRQIKRGLRFRPVEGQDPSLAWITVEEIPVTGLLDKAQEFFTPGHEES